MKIISIIATLFFFSFQNFPVQIGLNGMSEAEVIEVMRKNRNFYQETNFKNDSYKYLKFYNRTDEETFLVFLDTNNRVSFTRLLSDYSNYDNWINTLNKLCEGKGEELNWQFHEGTSEFSVQLKKEEWYFTITTRKITDKQ